MKILINLYCRGIFFLMCQLVGGSLVVKAQSGYTLVGSARSSTLPNYVLLTEERPGQPQTGALWYKQLLKLTESFELEFTMNFGASNFGSDGVALVMQTIGTNVLGGPGLGIGFRGLRPSLAIEFDTHYNSDVSDPRGDHMALIRDGNNNHQLNSLFAAPVPISTTSSSVKDGRDHFVKMSWNTVTKLLQVEVDCVPRISQSIDLINDVFGGTQAVYFGLTSSTGVVGNSNTVNVPDELNVRKTLQACPLDTLTLVTGLSIDGKYEWKPTTGLSNSHIRNPKLLATTNQVYTVSYVDRCSLLKNDSVSVKMNTPTLRIEGNREVCENGVIELNPILTPTSPNAKFRWSTGDTTRQYKPKTSGLYNLQVTINNCTVSDSATVTFHPFPKLGSLIDSTFDCLTDVPIRLDPKTGGQNLKFMWSPTGTNEPTLLASLPGRYVVKISSEFGCSVEQRFTILDNCLPATLVFIPDVFTPNGDGKNEVFEWTSNAEVEAQMKIYNRWGEVLFSSSNPREFWDGNWNGIPCLSGTYAWRLDYHSRQNKTDKWFVKRGEIILLR